MRTCLDTGRISRSMRLPDAPPSTRASAIRVRRCDAGVFQRNRPIATIAIAATVKKNGTRNAAGAPASKLKAAPVLRTYVKLTSPSITGIDSCNRMLETTHVFVS